MRLKVIVVWYVSTLILCRISVMSHQSKNWASWHWVLVPPNAKPPVVLKACAPFAGPRLPQALRRRAEPVAEVTDEAVILDANHPLAGQALTFAIELVEIA